MHAVDERDLLPEKFLCDRLVGRQHEVFDDARRIRRDFRDDIDRQPVFIENDLCLREIKVDGTALFPPSADLKRELIHERDHRCIFPVALRNFAHIAAFRSSGHILFLIRCVRRFRFSRVLQISCSCRILLFSSLLQISCTCWILFFSSLLQIFCTCRILLFSRFLQIIDISRILRDFLCRIQGVDHLLDLRIAHPLVHPNYALYDPMVGDRSVFVERHQG